MCPGFPKLCIVGYSITCPIGLSPYPLHFPPSAELMINDILEHLCLVEYYVMMRRVASTGVPWCLVSVLVQFSVNRWNFSTRKLQTCVSIDPEDLNKVSVNFIC